MSLKEQQPQSHDLRSGLAILNNHMVPMKQVDQKEQSVEKGFIRNDSISSNSASSSKNSDVTSTTPSSSNVKPVGSNKFVVFR